mgnify:FL=1
MIKKRCSFRFIALICLIAMSISLCSCSANNKKNDTAEYSIEKGDLKKVVFALVSSAENSSIDYGNQYSYIEDIGDGRGYTAGIIGFTSATGDLLEVVEKYTELKTSDNNLEKYIPALKQVIGSDSHAGLGSEFVSDWIEAAKKQELIQAQNIIVDHSYLHPAVEFANEDGLSVLGQYIYYDALVVHGPGDDEDSFNGIRVAAQKLSDTPAQGGSEKDYLLSFLEARTKIMEKEEAHTDLSRIRTQQKFIEESNYTLDLPLEWVMYEEDFKLTQEELEKMK